MKFFGNLFAVGGVILLDAVGAMGQKESDCVASLRAITSATADAQLAASQTTTKNFSEKGVQVLGFMKSAEASAEQFVSRYAKVSPGPFTDDESKEIANFFGGSVVVQQLLLDTLIEKHDIASSAFFTGPISESLRSLEPAIDSYLNLILTELKEEEFEAGEDQVAALNVAFKTAMATYSV